MLAKISLRLPLAFRYPPNLSKAGNLRSLSTVSVHSRLPTTVYRLQLVPKSNLAPYKDDTENVDEKVLVSDDGLVYPRVSDKLPEANGPIFMPNTILMQDLTRLAFDRYLEEDETSKPVLISLKKGTLFPTPLTAFSFDPSQFSIQSLHPMKLSQLNSILDELYSTEAIVCDAEKWFDQNPFHEAGPDIYPK